MGTIPLDEAIGGTIFHVRSSLSHKKLTCIFSFFYQASREFIRSPLFSFKPANQVMFLQGRESKGREQASVSLRVRFSRFTIRVMRCGVPSGLEVRKELMEMKHDF